eukprot:78828-Rhodomonas_salina.1
MVVVAVVVVQNALWPRTAEARRHGVPAQMGMRLGFGLERTHLHVRPHPAPPPKPSIPRSIRQVRARVCPSAFGAFRRADLSQSEPCSCLQSVASPQPEPPAHHKSLAFSRALSVAACTPIRVTGIPVTAPQLQHHRHHQACWDA